MNSIRSKRRYSQRRLASHGVTQRKSSHSPGLRFCKVTDDCPWLSPTLAKAPATIRSLHDSITKEDRYRIRQSDQSKDLAIKGNSCPPLRYHPTIPGLLAHVAFSERM